MVGNINQAKMKKMVTERFVIGNNPKKKKK